MTCFVSNRAPTEKDTINQRLWIHAKDKDWTVYMNENNGKWIKM